MVPSDATSTPSVSPRGSRRPALAGVVVLALLMLIGAVPAVRLALVEWFPVSALVEGVRMPAWLPRLGLPFGDNPGWGYWLVETVAALVVLAVFWVRCLAAYRPRRTRRRIAVQVWLDTVLAVLAGCVVHAVLSTFLTGDRPLPYLLLVGGAALFALVWGALTGLITAAAAAAVPAP